MAEYGDIGRGVFSEIGSATSGGGPGGTRTSQGSHLASIQTFLVQSDQRDTTTSEFVEEWRKRIGEVPGAESLTFAFSITGGGGSPIDVELSHPDSQTLELAASRLAREIGTYNGTRDLDNGVSLGKEQLDIQLTPQGRALGLTEFGLAQQIRASFYGSEAARQQRGRQEVRVFVRRPLEERQSLYNIEQMIVRTPSGGEIPLAQAANIQSGRAYTAIKRVDGRRTINVTSDVAEESANAQEIAQSLTKKELPALVADFPGLTYRFAGERKNQAEAMGALAIGFMLALLVMYGLLAVAFRSYVQPVIVMLAIPFGIVGALWGHAAFGYSFSIMSMMGMVALSGVVVNDSLVLIEAVNAFRRQGLGIWEAVVSGGLRRFRPILLTSLTTFFGLAPMIAEPSVQARFLIPMALSLGFGVLFATAILLLLVPCTYVIVEDVRWAFRALHAFYQDRPTPQMEQIEQPRYVPAE